MKLLIHICCAPCLIYPLEVLKLKGFEVSGFFYNPNIHPFLEYNERKKAIASLNPAIEVIYPDYSPREFFRAINPVRDTVSFSCLPVVSNGVNLKEEAPVRCAACWRLRLEKTARVAREKGFKYFTTTLLVSPYQDHEVLKKIGNEAAKDEGVEFYYADFRPGFRKAHDDAKLKNIYCQKYCGCIYSIRAITYSHFVFLPAGR